MKFTCDKDIITKEIAIAQEIIASRNSMSILSNVLLEVDNNTLSIKATDLKVGFETTLPVEQEEAGTTTVFCDKFIGILRSLPEGDVVFHHHDNVLFINPIKKNIDFQLKTISSENFPELQQIDQSKYFELGQQDIIEMISQTIFSVSEDETRYFMNGVYFVHNAGHLLMVATDGRRLSYISKDIPEIKEFNGIIIPSKILQLIKKLCSGEGNISLAVTDKHIFASFDNQKISSSLIEGQFPDYSRVIPEKQSHKVITSRTEFIEALRRVSLLVEQKSKRIYLLLKEGSLELSSEESDIGIARETIDCDYAGEEVKIALNYIYLMDPLKIMETDTFSINFTEASKALTLHAEPEAGYFHLIMPMQYE